MEELNNHVKATLRWIRSLKDDWDGYGAPAITERSIRHLKKVIYELPVKIMIDTEIYPTEYGGVQFLTKFDDGTRISADFGDETFSYYVDRSGQETLFFDFLPCEKSNYDKLIAELKC